MSKRIFFLYLLICLQIQFCFSQSDSLFHNDKLVFYLTFGTAIPIGTFSEFQLQKDADYNYYPINVIGGVKPGLNINISGKYFFSKNCGIQLKLASTSNKVKDLTYQELYPQSSAPSMGGGSNSKSFSYNSTNWLSNNVLTGFTLKLRDHTTSLSINLLLGFQQLKSPKIEINEALVYWRYSPPTYEEYNRTTFQSSVISNNFVFETGFDFKTRIIKKIGFVFSFSYMSSLPSFNRTVKYTTDNYNLAISNSFTKNVSFICFTSGFSYAIK